MSGPSDSDKLKDEIAGIIKRGMAKSSMGRHDLVAEEVMEAVGGMVAELEAALMPFAKIARHLTSSRYGPAWGFGDGIVEHEDFQRARATLGEKP